MHVILYNFCCSAGHALCICVSLHMQVWALYSTLEVMELCQPHVHAPCTNPCPTCHWLQELHVSLCLLCVTMVLAQANKTWGPCSLSRELDNCLQSSRLDLNVGMHMLCS